MKIFEATVSSIQDETPDIKTFVLRIEEPLKYIPGQYMMIHSKWDEHLKRAFSVLSYHDKEILFGIKKNGSFTQELWDTNEGDKYILTGSFGRFWTESEKAVFIAGGIGITPIYNMLKNRETKDFLFYSAKSEKDMAYIKEVSELNNKDINLFFTREKSDKGIFGRIDAKKVIEKIDNPDTYEFLLCGPHTMIEGIRKDLIKEEISPSKIRSEGF